MTSERPGSNPVVKLWSKRSVRCRRKRSSSWRPLDVRPRVPRSLLEPQPADGSRPDQRHRRPALATAPCFSTRVSAVA